MNFLLKSSNSFLCFNSSNSCSSSSVRTRKLSRRKRMRTRLSWMSKIRLKVAEMMIRTTPARPSSLAISYKRSLTLAKSTSSN